MSTSNSNEASGGGPHTHGQVNSAAPGIIHSNSDAFLNYLEKNRRSLKKRASGNASEKKSVDAELELIEKMRKHYLLSQTNTSNSLNAKMSLSSSHGQDQQGVSFSEALHRQQQELLERVADLIYFSKLAHMGRIQSDPLAKFYEDNLLAERKPYCEMTYGQERNALRDQLEAGILENESDLWVQLTSVEKSVLSDTIQPQILELDEQDEEEEEQGYAKQMDSSNIAGDHSAVEEEDEQFASKQLSKNYGQDGENDGDCSLQFIHAQHQKNLAMESSINNNLKGHCNPLQHQQQTSQQLPMLGHVYSQNYDGDSEKSHTENEIDMIHDRSKGKNILNSGGNGNNGNNNNTVVSQQQQQQQLLKKVEIEQEQYLSESQLQEQNQQQSQNAVKGFRRYKQNRYREERFAYQKKTKLQESIKEEVPRQKDAYESDQCQSVDVGTQVLSIEGQKQQQQRKEDLSNTSNNCNNNNDNDEDEEEDESSAAHSANQINNNDSNNSANNPSNNTNNNNNNNSLISGIANTNITHTKKHHGQNKTRHNPCRNDNQYETDREKEQEGSKKMLSTGQAKKTQVSQQQQQQQHVQDSPQ